MGLISRVSSRTNRENLYQKKLVQKCPFNHYHQTAQSRNPLTMAGIDDTPTYRRPKTPEVRPRSAQATSDLLSWSKPAAKITPQQARRQNRDKITNSSHNLLSHQEFQAKTPEKSKITSKSTSNIIAPEPQFENLVGNKRGKTPVKTSNYRSMKNDAATRKVTNWGTDDVKYQSKYNKLEDNSVSQKNREEYKRRNILHLTEKDETTNSKKTTCSDSYRKNFATSKGLIGGVGEGQTQNVKTMNELNKNFEKLSTRRENEINSSPLCRKDVNRPKWR